MSEEVKTEQHEEHGHDECCHDHKHHHRHHHRRDGAVILGPLWFIGWLFTLGFLHPDFLKGLLGIVIWPYYLGNWVYHLPNVLH